MILTSRGSFALFNDEFKGLGALVGYSRDEIGSGTTGKSVSSRILRANSNHVQLPPFAR
jgi:hypothetical protein